MKTLGILGGMGAEATALFYHTILDITPASSDQTHIPTVMINPTTLPDRSPYIHTNKCHELSPLIDQYTKKIEAAGADYIVMPCNTVHIFLPYLAPLGIPIINMIEETAKALHDTQIKSVGILATNATIQSRLYQTALAPFGIKTVLPVFLYQQMVMEVIYDVKAGKSKSIAQNKLQTIIDHLKESQVDCIILGCTELPLLITRIPHVHICDPLKILAQACVNYSLEKKPLPHPHHSETLPRQSSRDKTGINHVKLT